MKKILNLVLVLSYITVFGTENSGLALAAGAPLPISARSAILLDARTNRVLYSKRPNFARPAASTTKVMTALVVLENLPLNKVVRVPKSAEAIPASKLYLRSGERFYVKDLLKCLLINSANDVAHTLAVATAGSEARFAQMMTRKAKRIGARHTRFANASGLPRAGVQYTTAYDLAIIMKEARKNRFIDEILATRTTSVKALTGRRFYLRNHNRLLWSRPNKIQGKTGFTRSALHCFVGKIQTPRRGDVLVAIMGSLSPWRDLKILLGVTQLLDPVQIQFNRMKYDTRQVAEVQRSLWRAGYNAGVVDGKFGSRTLKALKSFQKSHGLSPDGILGPRTLAKLKPFLQA